MSFSSINMINKEEKQIINHLVEIGCCKRCSLRMLCRNLNFTDPDSLFTEEKPDDEGSRKKLKSNPCVVCLDLLDDSFLTELVASLQLLKTVEEYDSETFVCFLSAPPSILIREYSLKLYLQEKFPEFYTELKTPRQLNKVWKACIGNKLQKSLGKTLDDTSIFTIKFNIEYSCDEQEISIMTKLDPKRFNERLKHTRKCNGEVFSRNAIESSLMEINKETLKKYAELPPGIPSNRVTCKSIDVHSEPIFIAGRYCKHSRIIGQTPWVHEDTNIQDCVQDFIFRGIESVLGYSKSGLTFSASGREDYDVRCLGKGRPFYVQIDEPKVTKIPFEKFRQLEKKINACELVTVCDVQIVEKSNLKEIKLGEELKSKNYTALCIANCDTNIETIVKTINNQTLPIVLKQKTPIRVLHRRTLSTRNKTIHKMSAKAVKGHNNLFVLDLETQAGTYVKEFVHGDLGRTVPCIRTIIGGADADIVALDVNSINLDWPPKIDYGNLKHDTNEMNIIEC